MNKLKFLIECITKECLMEFYAAQRKQFINTIKTIRNQIIENWALCWYCQNIQEQREYNHWRRELLTHVGYLGNIELKNGDKLNCVKQNLNLNDSNWLYKSIINKFKKENLRLTKEILSSIEQHFNEHLDSLSKAIAEGKKSTQQYILSIFP